MNSARRLVVISGVLGNNDEMSSMGESLNELYRRFWGDLGGDSEADVAAAEQRLRLRLPAVLRSFYLAVPLRRSEQLHLLPLPELRVENDRLVFAIEQQGCWSWALRRDELQQDDPPLWTFGLSGPPLAKLLPAALGSKLGWGDDLEGCTVGQWLIVFLLMNRASTSPMVLEFAFLEHIGDRMRKAGWVDYSVQWKTLGATLWTWRGVVYDGLNLGAASREQLEEALVALGEDPGEYEFC